MINSKDVINEPTEQEAREILMKHINGMDDLSVVCKIVKWIVATNPKKYDTLNVYYKIFVETHQYNIQKTLEAIWERNLSQETAIPQPLKVTNKPNGIWENVKNNIWDQKKFLFAIMDAICASCCKNDVLSGIFSSKQKIVIHRDGYIFHTTVMNIFGTIGHWSIEPASTKNLRAYFFKRINELWYDYSNKFNRSLSSRVYPTDKNNISKPKKITAESNTELVSTMESLIDANVAILDIMVWHYMEWYACVNDILSPNIKSLETISLYTRNELWVTLDYANNVNAYYRYFKTTPIYKFISDENSMDGLLWHIRYLLWNKYSAENAEDILQNTLLKACKNRNLFDASTWFKVSTRIYAIAENATIDFLRASNRSPKIIHESDLYNDWDENPQLRNNLLVDSNTAWRLNKEWKEKKLEWLLKKLTKQQRELLQLRIDGFKYNEIAIKYDKPEGTIKSLIHRATERINLFLPEAHRLFGESSW